MFSFSIWSDTRVHGKFKPERKNIYTTLIGDHKIDLREAELSMDKPIRITVCKLIGDGKVIVPPSTRIDVGGVILLGDMKTSVDPGNEQSGAYVRVRYNCIIGDLKVTSED
jgi:predicted membrane protein